jgi:hypothetical protein
VHRTWLLAVAVLALLAPGSSVAIAGDLRDRSAHLTRDAEVYAARYGVAVSEAERRLDVQRMVGEISAKLESEQAQRFGGLYIEHEPQFKVVMLFTDGAESVVADYVTSSEIKDVLNVRIVNRTLDDLRADLVKLRRQIGIDYVSDVDVANNRLRVRAVPSVEIADLQRVAADVAIGSTFAIEPGGELPSPAISLYGGLWFYEAPNTSNGCTSGFTIVRNNPPLGQAARAVTTAGHCPNTLTVIRDGVGHFPLAYNNDEMKAGSHDEQSHRRYNSDIYPNRIVDGAGGDDVRDITATRARASQNVGDFVCHYGRVTDYGCGVIASKTLTPCGTGGNPSSTAIHVHSDSGIDLSQGGDSGGPWFIGSTALGTMSCQWGNDAIYVAINYVETGLDAVVATN